MKALLLSLLVLLAWSLPVLSQEATEAPDECRVAAQAWYDAIDPDLSLLASATAIASPSTRPSQKGTYLVTIDAVARAAASLDFPPCVAAARGWYLSGVAYLYVALSGWIDGNTTQFASQMPVATYEFGKFRGYLMALGVTVVIDGEGQYVFK